MKIIKISILVVITLLTLVFSVKFENLQKYNNRIGIRNFDSDKIANMLWEKEMDNCIRNAPNLEIVVSALHKPEGFQKYGKKLGISKTSYILVRGTGKIVDKSKDLLIVETNPNESISIQIGAVFGNAARDGSGIVNVNDYVNMTDFNNLSISLNKLIKEKVIDILPAHIKINSTIDFAGIFEVREDKKLPERFEIIPLKANLTDGE